MKFYQPAAAAGLAMTLLAASRMSEAQDGAPMSRLGWNSYQYTVPFVHNTKAFYFDSLWVAPPFAAQNKTGMRTWITVGNGISYQHQFLPIQATRGYAFTNFMNPGQDPTAYLAPMWSIPQVSMNGTIAPNGKGEFNSSNARLFVNGVASAAIGDTLATTPQGLVRQITGYVPTRFAAPYSIADLAYYQIIENTNSKAADGAGAIINVAGATKVTVAIGEAYAACVMNLGIETHSNGVISFHVGFKNLMDTLYQKDKTGTAMYVELYKSRNASCGTNAKNPTAQPPPMKITVVHMQAAPGGEKSWTANNVLLPLSAMYYSDPDFVLTGVTFLYNTKDILTYSPMHVSSVGRHMSAPYVKKAVAAGFNVGQFVADGGRAHSFENALEDFDNLSWSPDPEAK